MKLLNTSSLVIAAAALLAACGGPSSTDGQQQASQQRAAAAPVAPTNCANGDLGERSALYNKVTLTAVKEAFKDRIKVDVGGTDTEMKDTRVTLDVGKLKQLQAQVSAFGIKVHYGLNEDKFAPVFEFLKLDNNGAHVTPAGVLYIADNGELKVPGDATLPATLRDNYRAKARIDRKGNGSFSNIVTDPTKYPDPLSEWFQFPLKLDRLIKENNIENAVLVMECISELACYSGIIGLVTPGQGEEYRHMIAWHIDREEDAVDDYSLQQSRAEGDYHKRAADLGHLCPPRCK